MLIFDIQVINLQYLVQEWNCGLCGTGQAR